MTADDLAGSTLILRTLSRDGDEVALEAIREEMRAADAYRDAGCVGRLECAGGAHVATCPVAAAEAAWITAMDHRRKCV